MIGLMRDIILAVVCSDKQVDIVRKALSEKLEIPST